MSQQSANAKPPNAIKRSFRKTYHALGFSKSYNALLWFHLAGAMLAFCLAHTPYLAIDSYYRKKAAPGEWFYFRQPFYRAAITLHLAVVIPAGILAAVQFTPIVRHKALLFHRINGYMIILLVTLANISGLMVARRSFGGTIEVQTFVGVLAIATTVCMVLAYVNIKRLNIAAHRAWMLRCWAYLGTPITVRAVMSITAMIVGRIGEYYIAAPCKQIAFTALEYSARPDPNATGSYAACQADPTGWTAVKANLYNPEGVAQAMAGLQIGFGMGGMLALVIHSVAVEVYLGLTPKESERLRLVSRERRIERGLEKEEGGEKAGEAVVGEGIAKPAAMVTRESDVSLTSGEGK